MRKANYSDKEKVITILSNSFIENKSVNYIVHNDPKRIERTRYLMEYSFELCMISGEVYISDDDSG